MRVTAVLFTTLVGIVACGSPPPAAEPSRAEPTATPEALTASTEPEPELSDEAAALIAETEGTAPPTASGSASAPPPAADKGKGLDIVYRVKPDELRIEVLSATFVPTVKAVRVRGGWGVDITVEATSTSDVALLASDDGPLALAATVLRPSEEHSGDRRGASKDLVVTQTKTQTFHRIWPGAESKPLQAGQELLLQVGLWGIGKTPETRKPALRFFEVKLVVGGKGAAAIVQPPK